MGLKQKFKGDKIKKLLVRNYSMFSKRMIHFRKLIHCTILLAEKIPFVNSLVEGWKKRECDVMKMKQKICEEERKHSR